MVLDEETIKRELVSVMHSLYRRGLVSALSGNASVRIPGTNYVWITPTGVFKGGLTV
ncbi:MAG: class II aldolase/adducin family protein, partial [Desulfurococcaceae archaeon]|nr:class II aldolase/adducin family protein [Desulfurococcaceae archaeon]